MTALLIGMAVGLASSAHCAAMCGPLVSALGGWLPAVNATARCRYALLHHGARTLVYVALAVPVDFPGVKLVREAA